MPKGKIYCKVTVVLEQAVDYPDFYTKDDGTAMTLPEALDFERNMPQDEVIENFMDSLSYRSPTSVGTEVWFKAEDEAL